MPKYETLPTIPFKRSPVAHPVELPEIVHLDDPALAVLIDFKLTKPPIVSPELPIDNALNEMKISGVHLMLVTNEDKNVIGLIGTEDILGEKPIKLIQERRINRHEILVKMVMTNESDIVAFDFETLRYARVGNVIKTLKELHQHYALVIKFNSENKLIVRGLFSTSQISKQLHMDIT